MQIKKIRWSLAVVIILLAVGLTTEKLTQNARAASHTSKEAGHAHDKTTAEAPHEEAGYVHDEENVLEHSMETINKSYRVLRRQISDQSKNHSTIAVLHTMQVSALTAATQVSPIAKNLPKEKQGKFNLDFRRTIVELVIALMDIEAALLDSDNVKAKQAYLKLGAIKKKGHETFKEKEE